MTIAMSIVSVVGFVGCGWLAKEDFSARKRAEAWLKISFGAVFASELIMLLAR